MDVSIRVKGHLDWSNFVHSSVRGILLLRRGAESKDNSSIGE
jgi:hypothetical protein